MIKRYKGKIKILKAISQSARNIMKSWKTLLLFLVPTLGLSLLLEMALTESGFMSFFGGVMVSQLLVDSVKVFFVLLIIKTTSNVMKGASIQPVHIMKVCFSKIIQIVFLGIICSAALVLPTAIAMVLMYAITESQTAATLITAVVLGILCVKIIFSVHGVVIENLDGLEGVKESLSLTKGNFLKIFITVTSLVLINYGMNLLLDTWLKGQLAVYIVIPFVKALMAIFQVTLFTAMYHQVIRRLDLKEFYGDI
ncbi:hypothetical protein EZV73_13010 [Acidaminobacter sp. JC074]|uniref:hypothetical protein n=1 Tax=Acidaminobacter sp. JC074 TaxID=2530199 RepID=UPI001F0EBB11|nr:hypothetical protein [Acidaminobacter sp. JC074]MCH4888505.1 hypothetical protein [Acidaminobacter sp. JC074]